MNITIIGAGPIGCYAGYLLAKSGHSVAIYEEHAQIGLPIQCTGLLTADFDQFNLPKESFLINTFSQIEVNSPQNKLILEQKEYLIDRCKFDCFLAELAEKAGAKIYLQQSFLRKNESQELNHKEIIIKNIKTKKEIIVNSDIVIAADGPLSKTAQAYGFELSKRINYYGLQAVVKGNFNKKQYQTFFGREVCPDLFAWSVPESENTARVGLASTSKEVKKYFERFLEQYSQQYKFEIIEKQAGLIPLYSPQQKLQRENCYLLGDAAGLVKATTLGGIIPGMRAAQILVDCLNSGKNNLGKHYEQELKKLKREMNLHLRLRKIFNQFEDQDWDKLLGLLNQPKIKKVFAQESRDRPIPLVLKILLCEPRLLKFGKFLF